MTVCVIDEDPTTYVSLIGDFGAVLWFRTAETFIADFVSELADSVGDAVIVADVQLAGIGGIELIGHLRKRGLEVPVILVCRNADVATAVHAIRQGAADFVEKPIQASLLVTSIQRFHAGDSRS